MNGPIDPVDSAFESLRSQRWTAQPFSPEQEKKLMTELNSKVAANRFRNRLIVGAGLGALALAGAGFAATGGIQRLRTWLVNINVDGQTRQLVLGETGDGQMTITNDDGSTTDVHIATATGENGDQTRLVVRRVADGTDEESVIEHRRSLQVDVADASAVPLDKVRSYALMARWTEGARSVEMYADTSDGAEQGQAFVVVTGFEPQTESHVAAAPRLPAQLLSGEASLTVNEAGQISVEIVREDGAGERNVARLIFSATRDGAAAAMPEIPEMGGDMVKVRVDKESGKIDVDLPQSGSSPK